MEMANSRFSLFEHQSEFEDSLMRSALLFGFITPKGKKADHLRKAILSIVIYGKGMYDANTVTSIFNENFKLNQTDKDIEHQLNLLIRDGYVTKDENNHFHAVDTNKHGVSYFDRIETDTHSMLNHVVAKVSEKHPVSTSQKELIRNNAKKAL